MQDDQSRSDQDVVVSYCLFDTAFGTCGIGWSAQGLRRLQLPERDPGATERRLCRTLGTAADKCEPSPPVAHAIARLQGHFAGEAAEFADILVDLRGVPAFQRSIYDALRTIGRGQTVSYGELAERIGRPGAARDVGQAMGRNPVPIIIPCHRVLASGQKMGGFSAYGGIQTKQRLLELEGVRFGKPSDGQLALPLV